MVLKRMELENFSNIEKASLDFKPGINLISGDNGSGKSSIIKALSFLLFGITEKTNEDYMRWGADHFYLRGLFEHQNKEYGLDASFTVKKGCSRTLLIDDKALGGTSAEIMAHVGKVLDKDLCLASVFAMQGDLDLIYATPAARRSLLQKIYNLGFAKELDALSTETAQLSWKKAEADRERARTLGALETLKEEEYLPLPHTETVQAHLLEQARNHENAISIVKNKASKLEDLIKDSTARRAVVLELIADNQELMALAQAQADQDRSAIIVSMKNNAAAVEQAQQTLAALEAQTPAPPIRCPRLSDEELALLEGYEAEIVSRHAVWMEATKRMELLRAGKCGNCGTEFKATQEDIAEVEAEFLQGQEQVNVLKERHDQALLKKAAIENAEKAQAQAQMVETMRQERIESARQLLAMKLTTLENHKKSLEEHDIRVQNQLHQKQVLISSAQAELEVLPVADDIQEEYAKLKQDEAEYAEDLKRLSQLIQSYANAQMLNEATQKRNEQIQQDREIYAKKVAELDQTIADYDREEAVIAGAIDFFRKTLPTAVLQILVASLEKAANHFLIRAYGGRYQIKLVDTKTGIDILYGDADKSVISASGAEKSLINMGLKLGLVKISGLGIMLLDEADAYFSQEVAVEVFSVLQELISHQFISQVFIISHKPLIKQILEDSYNARVFVMNRGAIENVYGN